MAEKAAKTRFDISQFSGGGPRSAHDPRPSYRRRLAAIEAVLDAPEIYARRVKQRLDERAKRPPVKHVTVTHRSALPDLLAGLAAFRSWALCLVYDSELGRGGADAPSAASLKGIQATRRRSGPALAGTAASKTISAAPQTGFAGRCGMRKSRQPKLAGLDTRRAGNAHARFRLPRCVAAG